MLFGLSGLLIRLGNLEKVPYTYLPTYNYRYYTPCLCKIQEGIINFYLFIFRQGRRGSGVGGGDFINLAFLILLCVFPFKKRRIATAALRLRNDREGHPAGLRRIATAASRLRNDRERDSAGLRQIAAAASRLRKDKEGAFCGFKNGLARPLRGFAMTGRGILQI